MDKGVFITGASRSGTSMVAGLFGVHGLWHGPIKGPREINPKGFWESTYFPAGPKRERPEWPAFMRAHGYQRGAWFVKAGPEAWSILRPFKPLVVRCWCSMDRILASRARIGWEARPYIVEVAWQKMRAIEGQCVDVYPDDIAAGDYSSIIPAFEALGLTFDEQKAAEWISPEMYSR